MELWQELEHKRADLNASIKLLRTHGEKLAQAEHDYKVSLSQEALKLKADGMAVGMINLVIYGLKTVAELRLKRDIAQTMYDTNQEHINVMKLQMRIIENQLRREWDNA
jgi:hypothetical protein